jgi:hypothetical protein
VKYEVHNREKNNVRKVANNEKVKQAETKENLKGKPNITNYDKAWEDDRL